MSRVIDIDDDRNHYIGMDGEYEQWDIGPNVLAEVQPERKTGKWINIKGNNRADCNRCGTTGRAWMNFCFGCGADMRGEGENR